MSILDYFNKDKKETRADGVVTIFCDIKGIAVIVRDYEDGKEGSVATTNKMPIISS